MPTSATWTFSGDCLQPYWPNMAFPRISDVPMAPSLTIAKGTVLGKITATGKYAAYNDALSNGLEVARCIAQYSFTTDASSNITIEGEFGITHLTAPVYWNGPFWIADLTGYDAAAAVDFGARVIDGVILGIPLF